MLLILTDYHFNEVKGGGPAVSLRNLTTKLNIDHKFLFAKTKACDGTDLKEWSVRILIDDILKADLIYCNSLFSLKSGILPILICILFNKKVIVAPRGELLRGKLKKRFLKKQVYLAFFRNMYRHANVTLHFTSSQEAKESIEILGKVKSFIASNLVKEILPDSVARKEGKVIWYSRISKEKNLHLALQSFMASKLPIEFDIYGPIGDTAYFRKIEAQINRDNRISYKGIMARNALRDTLSQYDVFLFPTPAENFGHVIVEAVQSGLFVITGENIPFDFSGSMNCGISVDIRDLGALTESLESYYGNDFQIRNISWNLFLKSLYAGQEKDLQTYRHYLG